MGALLRSRGSGFLVRAAQTQGIVGAVSIGPNHSMWDTHPLADHIDVLVRVTETTAHANSCGFSETRTHGAPTRRVGSRPTVVA